MTYGKPLSTRSHDNLDKELKIVRRADYDPQYRPPAPWCDQYSAPGPNLKDCNRAFYNLGFVNGMLNSPNSVVSTTYGNCRMEVKCGGSPVKVSAGRLLNDVDYNKSGGYSSLSNTCLAKGFRGSIFVNGGCKIEVWRAW
ncbi:hypothetical protein CROQUDRAFT_50294 [Cronartium quercuum f. sp. fusiforme G11]|uniref:Uncharacterized protein n=1 Tax=Cronartium quercuum f. sp. fusiforme G11 TaxID=708437 RepID=A0A9P6T7Z2_9BASI|nr:hypothetical protein CROQUDRAFT_50294 [Cronartium quercuum f. sp. fusiforme G11]